MKILIANAIHVSKDYSLERWLKNVSSLQNNYPSDFLLVDNSPGNAYVKQIEKYCKKYGVKNYQIIHIELPLNQDKFERIARSREVIRKKVLSTYDAWFSWESDIIIPPGALGKLTEILNSGDYLIVAHNNRTRQIPEMPNYDWGVALVKREALLKYSFILDFGSDPQMPDTYEPSEEWFRKRIIAGGGKFIEVDGVFSVTHLNNP